MSWVTTAPSLTRYVVTAMWLGGPWRFAARLFIGVGWATIGRRQPIHLLGAVVVAAVLVAVVQAGQQGDIATALTVSSVALCAIVCPPADAAVSRRSEYAADRYAAACGAGPQLASALRAIGPGPSSWKVRWTRRILSRHPSVDRRPEELDAIVVIRSDARPPEVWGSASAWHDTATAACVITMSRTHADRSRPGRIDPLTPAPSTMCWTTRPGCSEEETRE